MKSSSKKINQRSFFHFFRSLRSTTNDPQFLFLIYKISQDILLLTILSFVAALFLEAVLPGMVSGNNGFFIVSAFAFAAISSLATIGKKLNIGFQHEKKQRFLPLILVVAFILIGNSMLKFALWENLLITTATLLIFFILYHSFSPLKRS